MYKKICLSIPIHTAPDVCKQHIDNIFFFVKNSIIVLHVTADQTQEFYNTVKEFESAYKGRVFVNTNRYHTHSETEHVIGLATIHASNYVYVKSQAQFDVFSVHASNEMFVRHGVEAMYDNFSMGITNTEPGYPGPNPWQDTSVIELQKHITLQDVYWGSVIEGSFFDTFIMDDIARITLAMANQPVPAEPLVFNTIALNLHKSVPVTKRVVLTNASQNVTHQMISETLSGANGYFALKTIPRNINDPLRVHLNNILRQTYGC